MCDGFKLHNVFENISKAFDSLTAGCEESVQELKTKLEKMSECHSVEVQELKAQLEEMSARHSAEVQELKSQSSAARDGSSDAAAMHKETKGKLCAALASLSASERKLAASESNVNRLQTRFKDFGSFRDLIVKTKYQRFSESAWKTQRRRWTTCGTLLNLWRKLAGIYKRKLAMY